MARRRDTVFAHRDSSGGRDLSRNLRPWQNPAVARLGALAELDLDHFDLFGGGLFLKAFRVEIAVRGSASEIAHSQVPR